MCFSSGIVVMMVLCRKTPIKLTPYVRARGGKGDRMVSEGESDERREKRRVRREERRVRSEKRRGEREESEKRVRRE
jgi:hypothetical protein